MIARREVEAGDITSLLSRLKMYPVTQEDAWRCRGQITLVVDGYNHDPRDLADTAAVRPKTAVNASLERLKFTRTFPKTLKKGVCWRGRFWHKT